MQDRPGWTKEMVQAEAHHLWCEDGYPDGDDQKYWFMAEKNLEEQRIRRLDPKFEMVLQILNGNNGNR